MLAEASGPAPIEPAEAWYVDPVRLLAEPGVIAQAVQRFTVEMSKSDREKFTEEMLQAAAWCGMVQLWRREVRFSPGERAGSDATLAIASVAGALVGRLQLKQLPDESRSSVGLQDLILSRRCAARSPRRGSGLRTSRGRPPTLVLLRERGRGSRPVRRDHRGHSSARLTPRPA